MFKALTLAASALLFACNGQDIPDVNNCVCNTQYEPVCCQGEPFTNECNAECAGFEPASDCVSGVCDVDTVNCAIDCLTDEYDPYCCNYALYDNSCLASCDGFTVASDCEAGECALKQLNETCGYTYTPPTYTMGECADGLYCLQDATIPDLAGTCVSLNFTTFNSTFWFNLTLDPTCAYACTADYDPVCCAGATFSNECQASCAFDFLDYFDVDAECTAGRCSNMTTDCICTQEYDPLCCAGTTFPNECSATCAFDFLDYFDVAAECTAGECADDTDDTDVGCYCPAVYEPVCCGDEQYSNLCSAACDGLGADDCDDGVCRDDDTDDTDGCTCPEYYDPICCGDEVYSNECFAGCVGFSEDECTAGVCADDTDDTDDTDVGCTCTQLYDPVCCVTDSGSEQYGNECEAACDGFGDAECSSGECADDTDDECICPQVYAPVCCSGQTFGNSCEAGCADGIDDAECTSGECDNEDDGCTCTELYEPYCCEGEDFSNDCYAACAGGYNVTESCVQEECGVSVSGAVSFQVGGLMLVALAWAGLV